MTVESFLHFWSRHNTAIIEILIALILGVVIYLAFRTFFGPQEEASSSNLNSTELEKTLQKILETQAQNGAGATLGTGMPGADGTGADGAAAGATAAASLEKLKKELAEKEQALEALRVQSAATAADDGEKKKLEERVKDLEARLAEYEIISEDIADLSFYKEENAKLQKELAARGGSAPSEAASDSSIAEPAPAAPAPAEPTPPAPAAAAPADAAPAASAPEAVPVTENPENSGAIVALGDQPDEAAKPEEPPAQTVDSATLLKEMAAVATSAPPPAAPTPDESQLMNQFENFVKKG